MQIKTGQTLLQYGLRSSGAVPGRIDIVHPGHEPAGFLRRASLVAMVAASALAMTLPGPARADEASRGGLSPQALGTYPNLVAGAPGPGTASGLEPTAAPSVTHVVSNNRSGERVIRSRASGYFPYNSLMEGGFKDKLDGRLHTLQDFLAGRAPFVSVAMDLVHGLKLGTRLRIPELDAKYGLSIEFRVVDTGHAFKNKGLRRFDICTANSAASQDDDINKTLEVHILP